MFESEEICWSINPLVILVRSYHCWIFLNLFLVLISNTCTIYSKVFPSRDTECIIMFYMPFYLASQQMINNLTMQLLYTSWLNLLIINFISSSVVSDSLWPHGLQHTRPPCPSPSPGVHSNSCPLSRWCQPTISSSVVPFSSRFHLYSRLCPI